MVWYISGEREYSKIIRPCNGGDEQHLEEPGPYRWEPEAQVNNGFMTLQKTFYFTLKDLPADSSFWEGDMQNDNQRLQVLPRVIPPSEIMKSEGFPRKGEALAEDPHYHYTGNGTLRHWHNDTRIWEFTAEYTNELQYDSDGNQVDDNTPPWKRKPTNVQIQFVEQEEPFTIGITGGNKQVSEAFAFDYASGICYRNPYHKNMIRNSAGDPINARTKRNYTQVSFTYNVKPSDFSVTDLISCIGSVNKSEIKVIGLTFAPGIARVVSLQPQYIDQWQDGSYQKKQSYWQISVTIQMNTNYESFNQKFLNVGNRAIFHLQSSNTDRITSKGVYLDGSGTAYKSRIIQWNSWGDNYGQAEGTPQFGPIDAALEAKKKYDKAMADANKKDIWPAFSYEEASDIPLSQNGTVDKYALVPNHERFGDYLMLEFKEYPNKDWDVLNMPEKGVDW